jgi:hypothetical protein
MEILALLLLFPVAWPFVAKAIFKHEYTLGEMTINIVVVVALVSGVWAAGRFSQVADKEVLNGQVTGKSRDRVSCEHSYSCNCTQQCSGSGNNQTCSTVCQTCYEHNEDFSYRLATTIETIDVDRIDRQGVQTPPRFTAAQVGDPVAVTHTHTNYIKGAPNSLFSAVAEQTALSRFGMSVPGYPLNIFDLHYLNRVLTDGVAVPDIADWNHDLAMRLRTLGPQKQVNWVVLFTKSVDPAYADAVRVKWLGGKKNDVVLVLGAPDYPKLAWARVLSWTDQELFKVQLRDDLQALETLDRASVLGLLEKHTQQSFIRKHMADFAYLYNEIQPPAWVLVIAGLLGIVSSVGLSLVFARNDIRSRGSFRWST